MMETFEKEEKRGDALSMQNKSLTEERARRARIQEIPWSTRAGKVSMGTKFAPFAKTGTPLMRKKKVSPGPG